MRIKSDMRLSVVLIFMMAALLSLPAAGHKGCSWNVTPDSVLLVPASVKEIPEYACADREDIREVRFAPGGLLKKIGAYAFSGCRNLKKVEIPEGCVDIASHAFDGCLNLESLELPVSLEHIGSNAFSFCKNLRKVKLPSALKELESYAFSDCLSLQEVIMPANSNLLGELIFSGCINLSLIVEPSPTPPPFDCNSYIFEYEAPEFEPEKDSYYNRCVLRVPHGSEGAYRRAHGWNLFTLLETM